MLSFSICTCGKFEVAGRPVDLRFGRQVLNLGESTFIPNGINVREPRRCRETSNTGLRTARGIVPVNMAKVSFAVSDMSPPRLFGCWSFAAPKSIRRGVIFSNNDFASRGGSRVYWASAAFLIYSLSALVPRDAIAREEITINTGPTSMSRRMVWAERSSAFILPIIIAGCP